MHAIEQPSDYKTNIDFWNGNQELHAGEMQAWNGYGTNETLLRVKKSVLDDLGFEVEPFPDSPATRTKKINPVIPPEDLEVWDREYKLWRPVLDVAKEEEASG